MPVHPHGVRTWRFSWRFRRIHRIFNRAPDSSFRGMRRYGKGQPHQDEDGNLVNPENVPIIVRLARARKMIEMLSSGTYKNKQEIGDMFGMSQAQVSRLCRSAFLSPVIVEKLVDGTLPLPRFTAVADKLITLPLWAEQHALLGID